MTLATYDPVSDAVSRLMACSRIPPSFKSGLAEAEAERLRFQSERQLAEINALRAALALAHGALIGARTIVELVERPPGAAGEMFERRRLVIIAALAALEQQQGE